MKHTTTHPTSDETIHDPGAALRLVGHQSDRVNRVFGVFNWALCMVWGIAWLVAYGLLAVATWWNAGVTPAWAFVVFGLTLVVAIVMSTGVAIKHSGGYRSSGGRYVDRNRQGVICPN